MHRSAVLLSVVIAGCTTSNGGPGPDNAGQDVVVASALAPSKVAALGVQETVTGSVKDAEASIRATSGVVAECLAGTVNREPLLRGTMNFRIHAGTPAVVDAPSGDLATLSATECVRGALAAVRLPAGATAPVDYALTFVGNGKSGDMPAQGRVHVEWLGVDWHAAQGAPPKEVGPALVHANEVLRRCALGAQPVLTEALWMTIRVKGKELSFTSNRDTDAGGCMQRRLRESGLPELPNAYAVSVVITPELFQPVANDGPANAAGTSSSGAAGSSRDTVEFGMIGLMNAGAGGDPDAPTAPWGRDDGLGLGADVGDAFGAGGLGLSGIGEGGSGRGEGIGLGNVGTIGTGAGTGTGQGFGSGHGRLASQRRDPPSIKPGATFVSGRLPPEVIKRIVRQNFGRFRLCYENGLRTNPKLAGTISVSFEIGREGAVGKISPKSDDMKNATMLACVGKTFAGLSFPQPEGGVVKVVYPIIFAPGGSETASTATASSTTKPVATAPIEEETGPTIGHRPLKEVTVQMIEVRLQERGYAISSVPASADDPAPVVFFGDGRETLQVLRMSPTKGGLEAPVCSEGKEGRFIDIRGQGCKAAMRALLD